MTGVLVSKEIRENSYDSNTRTGSLAGRIKARIKMPSEKKNWVHLESKQRGFPVNTDDLHVKVKPFMSSS